LPLGSKLYREGIDMQQAAMEVTQSNIHAIDSNIAGDRNESFPWFLIQPDNTRVRYRHDWVTDFFGGLDMKQDGLGLVFNYPRYIEPGTVLDIGIPVPEAMHRFQADVIVSAEKNGAYEIGIWLRTSSDADLELLLRSCEYAS
jgi:hypothetical protein